MDSLVGVGGLFKTNQVRIVSSLVRFRPKFNVNNGFGTSHFRDRFSAGLDCGWLREWHVLNRLVADDLTVSKLTSGRVQRNDN